MHHAMARHADNMLEHVMLDYTTFSGASLRAVAAVEQQASPNSPKGCVDSAQAKQEQEYYSFCSGSSCAYDILSCDMHHVRRIGCHNCTFKCNLYTCIVHRLLPTCLRLSPCTL